MQSNNHLNMITTLKEDVRKGKFQEGIVSSFLQCLQTENEVFIWRHGSCLHEPSSRVRFVFRFVETRTGASRETSTEPRILAVRTPTAELLKKIQAIA